MTTTQRTRSDPLIPTWRAMRRIASMGKITSRKKTNRKPIVCPIRKAVESVAGSMESLWV